MQVKIVVSVIIESAKKVLLLQVQSNSYKLPTENMEVQESPFDTARRILKEQGVGEKAEIKHLVGIYSLLDMEDEANTLVFAFVANIGEKLKIENEKFKIFTKKEVEKLVEEEKQLEDASIGVVILRDYLQGEKYSLDLIKRVEEVKL